MLAQRSVKVVCMSPKSQPATSAQSSVRGVLVKRLAEGLVTQHAN